MRVPIRACTLGIILSTTTICAQITPEDSLRYNASWNTSKRGMVVLSSWGAANITSSLILRPQTTGVSQRFHEMNGLWNTVNLGLGIGGYFYARKQLKKPMGLEFQSRIKKQIKVLKVNSYLDIGYMAIGLGGVLFADKFKQPDIARGYGYSLIGQGAFLFGFDLILARKLTKSVSGKLKD